MFEQLAEPHPSLGRVFDPPQPVWVDLAEAYRHVAGASDARPPLLVRNRGLTFEGLVTGEMYLWSRTARGAWLGLVAYSITAPSVGQVRVCHYVSQQAVKKRQPGEIEPPF